MVEDQPRCLVGEHRPALAAVEGVVQGLLVGPLTDGHPLHAHVQPRGIHHGEHVGEALVGLAHQLPPRPLEQHGAGGAAVDAQLVLDPAGAKLVGHAGLSVRIRKILGHQEQGDALHPFRRAGQAGQHQVHDVVRHVVIAPGDVDLLAGDPVGAVVGRLGRGPYQGQVGTRLRLRQVHGAGPVPGDHPGQVEGLLRRCSVGGQGLDRPLRQERAQAEGHVGGMDHLEHRQLQGLGQALAPMGGIGGQAVPAPLRELAIGVGKARGGEYPTVLEAGPVLVPGPVQGGQHPVGQGGRPLQHRAHHLGIIVGKSTGLGQPVDPRQLGQGEGQIADGGGIGHGNLGAVVPGQRQTAVLALPARGANRSAAAPRLGPLPGVEAGSRRRSAPGSPTDDPLPRRARP